MKNAKNLACPVSLIEPLPQQTLVLDIVMNKTSNFAVYLKK